MNCKMYFYLPREHGNKYLSTSYPARLSFSFSKLQFWNIIYDFIHRGQLDVGGRRCWTSLRHGGEAVVGGGGRGTDLWSWCSLRLSCAPLGIPGPACSGPTGPGPPPSPTLPSAFPQREILSPPQGLTALDRGGEFGFCDLTADSEHSLQRRSSQSRFSLSLSLSVVPRALEVFTLNSRPAKRIYSLITELKALSAGGGGVGRAGGMCVSLPPFLRETFGFM